MMFYTTLNKIRAHGPCESGWKTLTAALGSAWDHDADIPLSRIIETNGLQDALWALRAVDGCERVARLFACACAERALLRVQSTGREIDARSWAAIDTGRRHANGQATDEELAAALAAALVAAWDAAGDAAGAAALAAAWDAAGDAAWDAALNAAWDAALNAPGGAAWAAEVKEQTRILLELMEAA